MAFFRRNKEEDYEDEDEMLEEEGRSRKFNKRFKDLKGENKKKRKEPPKPWGKRERVLVLAILLSTVIISAILGFIASGKGFSGFKPEFSMPDFSFDIFTEKTIIIEK